MALSAGTRLGPYEIVALIGAGGMGEVYRARDTKLDRDVAIKVLPESLAQNAERLARFEREAKVLAALNHPNIASIYGVEDRALVMELVEGETLSGPLPLDTALDCARQIADALEAAHEKGIVHRDLKPANIKVTPQGVVKVLDFGLATVMQGTSGSAADPANSPTLTMQATQAGVIMGTAAYMSPEQAAGRPVDKRADIWSFGVVLFEMLSGQRLFEGETVSHTLAGVLKDSIDYSRLPSETPAPIRELLRRCLDRDVKNRLRDIGEGRLALQKYLANPISETEVPRQGQAASSPSQLGKLWLGIASLLALALGALSWVHFREAPPERQHIRFQIPPPEGHLFDFKLSPDGRFLAFATSDGLTTKIWIRALNNLETRLLASLPRADALFWSADGEYIGFSGPGKIYKIARTGGPPVAICDLQGTVYGGAAWRSDGTILFSSLGGIYRVLSSGGTPSKVSNENAAAPVWLAGERFLFTTRTGIFSSSLAGAKPSLLLPDVSTSVFVPPAKSGLPGYILFLRGETLMAQPIDPGKAELRGESFPVAEHVGSLGNTIAGVFSASATGVLAFGRSASTDRELVWLDRTGKKLQTASRPFVQAGNPAIRISADDSRAIVPVAGATGVDLWIAELNRHSLSRFTFDGATSGIWSPDGRMVLWSAPDGNRYLRSADNSGKDEFVFKNPTCNTCYLYDWSSDGKRIAFTETGEKTGVDIWLVAADGDRKPHPYLQSRFRKTWAQIAPDGRWMAYGSDQPGQQEILVESIPAGKGRWQISTEGGDWPVWRRDGKELFFRQGTKIMAVPVRLTETSVESGKPQALFEIPPDTRFQVSRDGQRFLIAVPVEGAPTASPLTVDTDWRAGVSK